MQTGGRDPSMEDILASIKKVIAEEKELRSAVTADEQQPEHESADAGDDDEDVLELDHPIEEAPATDLGPPLLDDDAAQSTMQSLQELSTVASTAPASAGNPLEDMVRDMLRPVLKEWLDEHLPGIVNEHVKREISRITGRKL